MEEYKPFKRCVNYRRGGHRVRFEEIPYMLLVEQSDPGEEQVPEIVKAKKRNMFSRLWNWILKKK